MCISSLGGGGYGCLGESVGVNRREASGNCQQWRNPITGKAGLSDERQVVVELEGISGACFLVAEKAPVARADDRVGQNLPGKPKARGEVSFVRLHQAARCTILSRENQFASGKIQISHLVLGVVNRGRVVIAETQVQREF